MCILDGSWPLRCYVGSTSAATRKSAWRALKTLCTSLGLRDVQTYIQSGNLVFREDGEDPVTLARRLEEGIEGEFGFRPAVIVRTASELRKVIAKNPFAGRAGIEPNKLLVVFMDNAPTRQARDQVLALPCDPEELRINGREALHLLPQRNGSPENTAGPAGEGAAMLVHRAKLEHRQQVNGHGGDAGRRSLAIAMPSAVPWFGGDPG